MREFVKRMLPENSIFGRVIRKSVGLIQRELLYRYRLYRYNRAILPLLRDSNLLSEKIKQLQLANKKKKAYIIRKKYAAVPPGLFSFVVNFFAYILYAVAKGMVPIIDMQSYPNIYMEDKKLGIENTWELYFRQPCGVSLNNLQTEAHWCVTYSNQHNSSKQALPIYLYGDEDNYERYFQIWATLYRHFFILSDKTAKYVDEEYNKIIKPGMRVVGVLYRGGDYRAMRPKGHAAQPKLEDLICKVQSIMGDWGCDYVYVATDERKAVIAFEKVFPSKVLSLSRFYFDDINLDYSKQYMGEAKFDRENDAYLNGLEYLTQIMILSRCTSAVLSMTNGSAAAMYINGGKYENLYTFDLGTY